MHRPLDVDWVCVVTVDQVAVVAVHSPDEIGKLAIAGGADNENAADFSARYSARSFNVARDLDPAGTMSGSKRPMLSQSSPEIYGLRVNAVLNGRSTARTTADPQ